MSIQIIEEPSVQKKVFIPQTYAELGLKVGDIVDTTYRGNRSGLRLLCGNGEAVDILHPRLVWESWEPLTNGETDRLVVCSYTYDLGPNACFLKDRRLGDNAADVEKAFLVVDAEATRGHKILIVGYTYTLFNLLNPAEVYESRQTHILGLSAEIDLKIRITFSKPLA